MLLSNRCKKELIDLLYLVISDWAHNSGYKCSKRFLLTFDLDFVQEASWADTYNGREVSVIGVMRSSIRRICFARQFVRLDSMSTLVHELAHAVQLFNYGRLFDFAYSKEVMQQPHETNKFECEANMAELCFLNVLTKDKGLARDLVYFTFDYAPAKRLMESNVHEYYTPEWPYWNEPGFKAHRKSWWLRR